MPREGNSAFSAALLEPDAPVPQNIVDPEGCIAPKRFAVYRNNVTTSLTEAMGSTFVSVKNMVGENFFNQVARAFIRANPPKSPVLYEYGEGFDDMLAGIEQLKHLPFLPEIARADRAWLESFHAADSAILSPEEMGAIAPDELDGLRFVAHPAARLIRSDYPLHAIWISARDAKMPENAEGAQSILITRPDIEVRSMALDAAQTGFFASLIDGAPLGVAAEVAMSISDEFDLPGALGLVLQSGAFGPLVPGERGQ